MKDNLNNLFEIDESLNLEFNLKKMFLEGYKITPAKPKWVMYPFLILMFIIVFIGLVGEIFHFIEYGVGLGINSLLPAFLVIGICVTVYVGTAHYWFKINQKARLNNLSWTTLKQEYPDFVYRGGARKELYDRMLSVLDVKYFIPRIKYEYTYQSEYIEVSVAEVTRTVSDNLTTGANSQELFTAVFITINKCVFPTVKLLKTEEVLDWLSSELDINLEALSGYALKLRTKNNNIILEFEGEITNPENKLMLLEYLQLQISKTIKKESE